MHSHWFDASGKCTASEAAAMAAVLKSAFGDKHVTCGDSEFANGAMHVASYKADFGFLWRLIDCGLPDVSAALDLVVVWDGVPTRQDKGWPAGAIATNANTKVDESITPADAMSVSALSFADHLTVFDWLVALACMAERWKSAKKPLLTLRVFILDLVPPEHSAAFAVRMLPDLLSRVSWIRVYRPFARFAAQFRNLLDRSSAAEGTNGDESVSNRDLLAVASIPDILDLETLLSDLGVGASVRLRIPSINEDRLLAETTSMLRDIWCNHLMKAESRHSLANAVGPAVLLEAMGIHVPMVGSDCSMITAVHSLIKALNLASAVTEAVKAPWIPRERWEDLVERFILVDDMAEFGWKHFVAGALDIDDLTQLACCAFPDSKGFGSDGRNGIIDLLTDKVQHAAPSDTAEVLRINRRLRLTGRDREVVFLDLRLFSDRAMDEEFAFLRRLLALAKQASVGTPGLPWPGFSSDELAAITRCIEVRQVENSDYHLALTMLPRLMALVDPTLPIVLFSSTGQRHVIEALARYRNVVVEFEKPRFNGLSTAIAVAEARTRFRQAFEGALALARGRDVCIKLQQMRTDTVRSPPKNSCGHVEVYIEETGVPGQGQFSVGGLVVAYPNRDVAEQFHIALRDKQLRWGWHRDDPFEPAPPFSLRKSSHGVRPQELQATLTGLQGAARDHSLQVGVVLLGTAQSSLRDESWSGPDRLYRRLLSLAIELVIFEWLPRYSASANTTLAIFAARRMMHPSASLVGLSREFGLGLTEWSGRNATPTPGVYVIEPQDVERALQTLNREDTAFVRRDRQNSAFVVAASPADIPNCARPANELSAFVFNNDDVYPIVEQVLDNRQGANKAPEIATARGVSFRYYDQDLNVTPDELPRQIHYAADWVIKHLKQVPPLWKSRGFVEDNVDEAILALIESCRSADAGHRAHAVYEWWRAGGRASDQISTWAADRVAKCATEMSGSDFVELCRRIDIGCAKDGSVINLVGSC